jgi:3-hydroxyisobutyrate dehydrogenase-like beta-hydroxyacid dehydrogenase
VFEYRPTLLTNEETNMKVGFVGLGQMGKHMALNLASARHQLIVSDIRTDAFPEFQERGVKVTTDVRDVAAADIIFLSLPNGDVLKSALFGPSGMADCLRPGQIIIDTSTITYAATVQIAKDLDARGVIFLDAPVSGMEARAKDATLTFMCGGSRDTFETVQPLLAHMGNKIRGCSGRMMDFSRISTKLTPLLGQVVGERS